MLSDFRLPVVPTQAAKTGKKVLAGSNHGLIVFCAAPIVRLSLVTAEGGSHIWQRIRPSLYCLLFGLNSGRG